MAGEGGLRLDRRVDRVAGMTPKEVDHDVDLLCTTVHASATALTAERLRIVSATDWADLMEAITAHHVAPIAGRRLMKADVRDAVPADVRTFLQADYLRTARRNGLLYERLAVVLRALCAAGVDAIVLKGAHLAER